MLKTNILIFSVGFFSILFFIFAIRANSTQNSDFCLKKSYEFYKNEFMSQDGRIMDPEKNNITTSEGQSYMLLRTVVMNDPKTFNLVYKWTKNNLQRKDGLFSWLWGKSQSGKYGVLDYNSASDADVDIAFSLCLAYEKWGKEQYLQEAVPIIQSIWNNETRRFGQYLVLMPGVGQTSSKKVELNPSYFSPYAFRFFQKYDELHDWNYLIDSSYYYIMAASSKTKTGLPPNWFLLENGQIVLEDSPRSDFSYDAVRVFKNVYMDYIRTGEKRALPILAKSKFFIAKWKESKSFYTNYKSDGMLRDNSQFIGSIVTLIPPISVYDGKVAIEIYDSEVEPYFSNKKNWTGRHDYYGKNLLWFGCHFYNKKSKEYKEMQKISKKVTDY
ncbi:MAG: glycosyl hydrolase family 8 [Candidatus Gastranaerophilaceae bacterium]